MPGYIGVSDLLEAATSGPNLFGAPLVDFTQYSAEQLQSLINRAAAQIDGYCKQTFQLTNIMDRYVGRGTNTLFLRKHPLAQITDSILGANAFGAVSQSLVVDTTFTVPITSGQITGGINAVTVADISNILPGQTLQWGDGTGEVGAEIVTVSPATALAVSGPGTVTLKANLTLPHPTPPANGFSPRVVVNTLDMLSIVLPGQAFFALPLTQFVVDAKKGEILNYTPLMFQNLGYATIFPAMLPLVVRYTYGYLLGQFPLTLQEVNVEQARRIAMMNMHLGAAGMMSIKSGDVSVGYGIWHPVGLGEDLKEMLGPFRRNVGMR